jgi:membrane-associated phospholipid phosphatase
MKRLLCITVTVCLFFSALAQTDSVQVTQRDTVSVSDTLRTNFPTSYHSSYNSEKTKQQIYKLKPAVDIPVFAVGAGWSAYAFTKIYSKPQSSEEEILNLNKNNIPWFDRWAVRPFSESLDRISYYPFFASMPLPFLFLTGEQTRKDFFKLTFLYLEAMSITGFLYTGSVYFVDRYRPYAYTDESTIEQRTRGGAKNSFYAGHVALVATSTFFMAKVYADYHPDSNVKWLFYTLAGATTAATAGLRLAAGQHFPSDLVLGIVQGTLTGLLVPALHKHKLIKDQNLSIMPYGNGKSFGFACLYHIK